MTRIIVDAMGGDRAPGCVVQGALLALEQLDRVEILLVGREREIRDAMMGKDDPRMIVHPASQVIKMQDAPALAVRRMRDSSMVVGMNLLADKKADALISAGSTGALLTAGLLIVKCLDGVHRPALAPLIPNRAGGQTLLIDCGANVDCKPIHLQQFAAMGAAYMRTMGVSDPKVGLINIGAEAEKGNALVKEAHGKLKEMPIRFVGNIEAREILSAQADVLVCDAFVGNVVLKFMEGMASAMLGMLKEKFTQKLIYKLGAGMLRPAFREFKSKLDYSDHGGAPLLGLNALVLKTHGSADARAIASTILQAHEFTNRGLIGNVGAQIKESGALFER